jgi:hypothetical protein
VTDVRLGLGLVLEADPGVLTASALDGLEFYFSSAAPGAAAIPAAGAETGD